MLYRVCLTWARGETHSLLTLPFSSTYPLRSSTTISLLSVACPTLAPGMGAAFNGTVPYHSFFSLRDTSIRLSLLLWKELQARTTSPISQVQN